MSITVLLVIFSTILFLWKLCSKPAKFPPGPFRWPIIGNMLSLRGRLIHESLDEFSKKFGDIIGIYVGQTPLIVISDLAAIREACLLDELSGRPVTELAVKVNKGVIKGLIFSQGDLWKEQRRFTLKHLKELGFGKHSMEGLIHEEIIELLKEIDRLGGNGNTPVDLFHLIGTSVINILWHVIAGQRYEYDNEKLQRLLTLAKELLTKTDASGNVGQNFPLLFKLCPQLTEYRTILEAKTNVRNFVKEDLEEHKKTLDSENPRDFLDIYLIEMEKSLKKSQQTTFYEEQLLDICKDLFLAGYDTTFNSITYAIAYMLNYPEVQKKIQQEVDQVVGQCRLPGLYDRQNLVYTDATLHELMRVCTVAPLGVPHAPLSQDVCFRGYKIPKNSRILFNLMHIHMSPTIWGDPENFRPERFIEDGKFIRKEGLLPFGTGKRQCIGESLAKNNVFLMFSAILQKYTLSVPAWQYAPSLDPVGGFTLGPKPFKCLIKQRV